MWVAGSRRDTRGCPEQPFWQLSQRCVSLTFAVRKIQLLTCGTAGLAPGNAVTRLWQPRVCQQWGFQWQQGLVASRCQPIRLAPGHDCRDGHCLQTWGQGKSLLPADSGQWPKAGRQRVPLCQP